MESLPLVWLASFALPILLLLIITKRSHKFLEGSWLQNIIILFFVLVSALIALFFLKHFSISFPWQPSFSSLALVVLTSFTSIVLVKEFGFIYIVSVFVQELCLLANSLLFIHLANIWLAILLIVPLYAVSHLQTLDTWKIKMLFTTAWGFAAILLFHLLHDFYLISSIHLIIGAILIKKKILFTRTKIDR